jgi:hypothetical protein
MIQKKEWMRICFELLELLKADKATVRIIATQAFAYIARAIGPFDVLLALLGNQQVQERRFPYAQHPRSRFSPITAKHSTFGQRS